MRAPIFLLANTSAKKVTVIITVLGITLAGCASMRTKKVIKTEDLLTKAGFQMRLADTPEKLAHLKTLPQRKIVRHQRNGNFRYVYADTTSCKCLYILSVLPEPPAREGCCRPSTREHGAVWECADGLGVVD